MQKERIEAQITAKGWACVKLYEESGKSGGTLDRPALQEMLGDIEAGKLQAVVVYKLDRFSRKQKDTMYLIEDIFLANGVELASISESLDTSSPTGRAMIDMLSVFAQLERDIITERLFSGRKQKAKMGGYSGGQAPLGYTATKQQSPHIRGTRGGGCPPCLRAPSRGRTHPPVHRGSAQLRGLYHQTGGAISADTGHAHSQTRGDLSSDLSL